MQNPVKRSPFVVFAALALLASSTAAVVAQNFCDPGETLTQRPADLVARTVNNGAWITGVFDGGGTDLTFDDAGATSRVLLTDPFVNGTVAVINGELSRSDTSFQPNFQEIISAIGAIPNSVGRFFVVDPDLTAVFIVDGDVVPRIGVMNSQGSLVEAFRPIQGIPVTSFITAIDVSPDGAEIAALDTLRNQVYIFDSTNFSLRSTIALLGFPTSRWRGGLAWGSCDTILAVSAFRDIFRSSVVLEYDRNTGVYTERGIELQNIAAPDGAIESVAIDVGFTDNKEVLYVYNALTDDVYAVDLDYSLLPGRVFNFTCSRGADGEGPVTLSWTNSTAFNYDEIVLFQNDVKIETLPSVTTSLALPPTFQGYSDFSIETRSQGRENPIRQYCNDIRDDSPSWTPFDAVALPIGFTNFGAFTGMDATPVVTDIFDAEVFLLDSTSDGFLRVFKYVRNPINQLVVLDTTLLLGLVNPGGVIADFRGMAVMDIGGAQRLVVSGVSAGGLPVGAIYDMDGSVFRFVNPIDTTLVGGPQSVDLTDWSDDENGDLISYDIFGNRLIRFEIDLDDSTITAVQEAPAPQCAVYDCGEPISAGAVTVLASGLYCVTSGSVGDPTTNRAHLSTPFDPDPSKSVKFVGQTQGLRVASDFLPFNTLGLGLGPFTIFGTCHTYFDLIDPDTLEPAPESVLFYDFPNVPGHPLPLVGTDFTAVVNLTGASGHPDYEAEQLVDMRSASASFTTPVATPTFTTRAQTLDYYYYVVNRGSNDASLTIGVLLDGVVVAVTNEDLVMPPQRSVYRALEARTETEISVRVTKTSGSGEVQVLIGARAITGEDTEPIFIRGDVDANGVVNINDPLRNLSFQFFGGDNRPTCLDSADTDDNGAIDINDPVRSLTFQFLGGVIIPLPGAVNCGPDPTPDDNDEKDLRCEAFGPCDP